MLALVLRQKVMCIFVLLEANCCGNKHNCAVERKRPHRKGDQFLWEAKKKDKDLSSQSYVFSHSHVWMWELDYKESWVLKNWCFWTVMLEKTLVSPLDCKIQPVDPKGNQFWIFIGRTDAKAETPMLWPPEAKNQLNWKRPWCWERLKAGGEGDNRGWDGWMASLTRWTWVWVSSRSWWWTEKPGVLLQRLGHDWVTELNWLKYP